MTIKKDSQNLAEWYRANRRELPWRKDRDPYRIWISEIMLQQTTVAAVVPFYDRFLKRFPTLDVLATSPLEEVLEQWAGLGYYSRARNLHKASQLLNETGFPETAAELMELPGFGPYTSRAVSSLAFNEKTGVLDGNVIRVLSRMYGKKLEWWKPSGRQELQEIADRLARSEDPADINQGMMELGAMICTPTSPTCLMCPWRKDCVARIENRMSELPLKRPRRETEVWLWKPRIVMKKNEVFVQPNDYAPFLKSHDLPPGTVKRLKSPPKRFSFRGAVTHHDIFVQVERGTPADAKSRLRDGRWVALANLKKSIPVSLIRKAVAWTEPEK